MTEYYSIQSSKDVIEHHGVKGMKWGRRMAKGIKSWMAKQNEKYYDSHNGLLNDYYYQKKKNNVEWKAVQKHTGAKENSFSPPSKEILKRQKEEYAKLKSYKDEMSHLDWYKKETGSHMNDRKYVKKEHLAEYDKLQKITGKYRPQWGKGYDDWGKAYDRQSELTRIGVDHRYAKAAKAYNDYINK